jgi:hypothetical protein
LREVLTFNGMYGNLSNKNNPAIHPSELFQFPENSIVFGKEPYMEASVGLENIFKVMRIDYFWRLTYLDAPEINKTGIRFAFRFSF